MSHHPRTVTVTFASSALPPSARKAVMAAAGLNVPDAFEIAVSFETSAATSAKALAKAASTESAATALSVNETRKFLDGITADTTLALLTEIARQPRHRFKVRDVLRGLKWTEGDLKGPLGGITKRVRTVSGDKDAAFFVSVSWDGDIDSAVSEVHPVTHAALRELLPAWKK